MERSHTDHYETDREGGLDRAVQGLICQSAQDGAEQRGDDVDVRVFSHF